MAKGGYRPNSGGKRAGAGKPLHPSVIRLREWYRAVLWRDREKHYRIALEWAGKGDTALLAKLIDKVIPTPTELDVNINRIPGDFVFRCELTTRGGLASSPSVAVPEGGRGGSSD